MSIFFMLSGFVLSFRYHDLHEFNRDDYIRHRVARVYPVYILSLVITIPWMFPAGTLDAQSTIGAIARVVILIFVGLFLLQAWLTPLFGYWNFGASWSISVEAFLYTLFVLVQKFVLGASFKKLLALSIGLYGTAILPGLVIRFFGMQQAAPVVQFYSMPVFRASEFILGMVAFRVFAASQAGRKLFLLTSALSISAFLLILTLINTLPGGYYIELSWVVIPVVFLLLVALSKQNRMTQFLGIAPIQFAGKASYSFYSLQTLVIALLVTFHTQLVTWFPVLHKNGALGLLALVSLSILSSICYVFFEEPMRKRLNRYRLAKT